MTVKAPSVSRAAAVYAAGDILIRSLSFFLLPVYTRYLSPSDYGILGGVNAFATVLGLFLQLNLNSALLRFHAACVDSREQRRLAGTVAGAMLIWALIAVVSLNLAGPVLLDGVFAEIRFEPYLRMATWLAFVNTFGLIPLTLLQLQHRPVLHRGLALTSFMLSTALSLALVVGFDMGARGAILGLIGGAALAGIPFLAALKSSADLVIDPAVLRRCLVFSLPLTLYAAGGWIMDTSNRVFLERLGSLPDLGLFNLSSQFAMVLALFVSAVGTAFTPMFYEIVKEENPGQRLARFGLLYVAGTVFAALAIAVFSREAILLLTPERFHGAYAAVPLLVATQALTCCWHLSVNPIMLREKTGYLTVFMIGAATVSVALNTVLIPRFGIVGAALSPLAANMLINVAAFLLSRRLLPVPYSYGAMAVIAGVGTVLFIAANAVPDGNLAAAAGVRFALVMAFPAILSGLGIIRIPDLRSLWMKST